MGNPIDYALIVDVQLISEPDIVMFIDSLKQNMIAWYRAGGPSLKLSVEFDTIEPTICTLDRLASAIRNQTIHAHIPTKFPDGEYKYLP